MRVVRDHPEGRWLPSRSNFALFRLFGLLKLRSAARTTTPGVILVVDRHQNAVENHLLSVLVPLVVIAYSLALLQSSVGVIASLLIGFLATFVFIWAGVAIAPVASLVGIAPTVRHRINAIIMMTTLVIASAYFAFTQSWARWLGRLFLTVFALNMLAAAALWIARKQVQAIELEYEEPA